MVKFCILKFKKKIRYLCATYALNLFKKIKIIHKITKEIRIHYNIYIIPIISENWTLN